MFSPFQQCSIELYQWRALIICRQDPQFDRTVSPQVYPEDYLDIRANGKYADVTVDTPSAREPSYQFFGRKRLLLRAPMSGNSPALCPGDTVEIYGDSKLPKRLLLANYDPVPFVKGDTEEVAQFIAYEMDQDVKWEQRRADNIDPVTQLPIESPANVPSKVIPVTLESLYEERDRSLVVKQDKRRVITGAPLKGGDIIHLFGSNDFERDEVEMKIVRVEYLSGIYVCEAL